MYSAGYKWVYTALRGAGFERVREAGPFFYFLPAWRKGHFLTKKAEFEEM